MMAASVLGIFCLIIFSCSTSSMAESTGVDFYSFSVKDIDGGDVSLERYRGSVALVVNVASECGYTDKHYKALVELQDELSSTKKFHVLAFPCNQFGHQEPKSNPEIAMFAQNNYKVQFPVFAKIDVVGDKADPAFANLIDQSMKTPTWNFWKYLVGPDGIVIDAWGPQKSVASISDAVRDAVSLASNTILESSRAEDRQPHREL